MSTLSKYKARLSPARIGGFFRRRWVIARLHTSRVADMGRTAAFHDLRGLFFFLVSALGLVWGKLFSLVRRIFLTAAGRLSVYIEPVAEFLTAGAAELRLERLRIAGRQRDRSRLLPAMMLVTITVCIFTLSYFAVGLRVEINGVPVGYVSSMDEMEEVLAQVEDRVSEYIGAPYSLDLDVTYSMGYDDGAHRIDKEYISNYVLSTIDNITARYVLTVDGQPVGANSSRTALELLRQRMLELNAYDYRGGKLEFVQDVQVTPIGSLDAPDMTVDEIQQKLSGNVRNAVVYTVQPGDTVSGIAQKYSTSVSDILAMNPGMVAEKIHVGDSVTVSASQPMLSVKETVTETYTRRIGYETEKRTTDELYTTQSRVVKSGVYGEANVTADVVYVNGQEESRTVMDWQVTKEPESEIVEVGTKKPPAKSPTGTFRKPSNGVFSSGYGYRRNLGDFHTGVDFAGPVGTAIYAADGGKVTFAGWKGNYGYCVFIDHGNGFTTVYAHCSKLLVKAGQSVAKGENIAKVGATGRVTGPHVHFEIRINGQHVNPLNYISK